MKLPPSLSLLITYLRRIETLTSSPSTPTPLPLYDWRPLLPLTSPSPGRNVERHFPPPQQKHGVPLNFYPHSHNKSMDCPPPPCPPSSPVPFAPQQREVYCPPHPLMHWDVPQLPVFPQCGSIPPLLVENPATWYRTARKPNA